MKATSVLCLQLTPVHLYPENLGLPSFENHGHSTSGHFPTLRHFPKLNVSELAEILSLLIIPSFSASEDQFPVNYTPFPTGWQYRRLLLGSIGLYLLLTSSVSSISTPVLDPTSSVPQGCSDYLKQAPTE